MLTERIRKLRKWLIRPRSKYRIGDAVRLRGAGNDLMVVIEVWLRRGMDEPMVHCQFSTPNSAAESEFFPESAIEPFDWDKAHLEKQKDAPSGITQLKRI